MLHHVSVGVADVARAAKFYDAVLEDHPEFWIQLPHDQKPMSVGNGVHLGFSARSKDQVLKFHAAALREGGSNNGEPGPRPDYGPDYFGAFIYDLDGNKIEATLHPQPPKMKTQAAKKPAKKAARKPAKKAAKKAPAGKKAKRKGRR
jgi:catechol 2,3-dioxygenase-like lactoylglutathione lyase family enzyme